MNKIIISIFALVGMWTVETESNAQLYIVKNGSIVYSLEEGTVDYIAIEKPIKTDFVGEAVDMGLSVKWSSVNLGARSPEELGISVAWGETDAKDEYTWKRYKHAQYSSLDISKYQVPDEQVKACWYVHNFVGDNKTILELEDDAAHVNWGGDWTMPSQNDWEEICENCTYEWTAQNAVNGCKITGVNGNSIFLPAAGYRDASWPRYPEGYGGLYWSSSLEDYSSSCGSGLYFSKSSFSNYTSFNGDYRYSGRSVRPVCPSAGDTNGHVAVDLGLPSGKLWATCNVGASEPEAAGDYFAWGETEAKEVYDWSTYKHIKEGAYHDWTNIDKYTIADGDYRWYDVIWYEAGEFIGDGKTTLEAQDDAATVNWGENWRMPTAKEWEELTNEENCTWTWKEMNGVNGYEVVSKITGNSIFLPAMYGNRGFYWSSSLSEDYSSNSRCLKFNSGNISIVGSFSQRRAGYKIRPVQE